VVIQLMLNGVAFGAEWRKELPCIVFYCFPIFTIFLKLSGFSIHELLAIRT
jgi:hypothetical protein